jgi:micrococcal nuclease
MRKRTGSIAMIGAATGIAFFSMPSQKEETAQENTVQVTENQVSNVLLL